MDGIFISSSEAHDAMKDSKKFFTGMFTNFAIEFLSYSGIIALVGTGRDIFLCLSFVRAGVPHGKLTYVHE
jgi:hypothetical protein